MSSISDTIERKFIESFDINDWEVETENGFVDIISSNKTIDYEVYQLALDNGLEIQCADTHILIDELYNEIFAKDSLNINLRTKLGISKVISVTNLGYSENMYDLSVNSVDHTYYTNNILSHNTTTAAAYFLWHTLFSDNKTVAVLANKEDAAMETLSRYQIMYENLPLWLQQGVKTWNKGSIELENGSKVITAATTSSGIRGKTISILYIDEAAIIPNNIADAFLTSVFPVVSSGTTTKILISSTPRGYNHFWKLWNDAKEGRNGFITYEIHYSEVPGKNKKWAEEQRKTLGDVGFAQEVECLGGNETVTIRNKNTNKIEIITLEKLHDLLSINN